MGAYKDSPRQYRHLTLSAATVQWLRDEADRREGRGNYGLGRVVDDLVNEEIERRAKKNAKRAR